MQALNDKKGHHIKRFLVHFPYLFQYGSLADIRYRMLLIEYVASTATGHSAEGALARKNKQSLPFPVWVFERMSYRLLTEHMSVLLLAISTHESAPYAGLCFTPLIILQAYFMYTVKVSCHTIHVRLPVLDFGV